MMRASKRAVAVGVLAALGAAGCSTGGSASGGGSPSPAHAVQTAYTNTLAAKSADFTFSESIQSKSSAGSNQSETVTGTGAVDLTDSNFQLEANAPSGGTVEVLQVGTVEYIQVPPAQRASVPGGKAWESIDLNQVDEAKLGSSFAQLASVNSDNPAQVLSNLGAVSSTVTRAGSLTIDGIPTVEYRAEIDLAKVASRVGAKAGPKAAAAVTQEEQALGTDSLPVDVWIDGKGLLRRVSERVPIPAASSGATNGSGNATVTMSFSNFGTVTSLTPPPAAEVADITAQVVQAAQQAPAG